MFRPINYSRFFTHFVRDSRGGATVLKVGNNFLTQTFCIPEGSWNRTAQFLTRDSIMQSTLCYRHPPPSVRLSHVWISENGWINRPSFLVLRHKPSTWMSEIYLDLYRPIYKLPHHVKTFPFPFNSFTRNWNAVDKLESLCILGRLLHFTRMIYNRDLYISAIRLTIAYMYIAFFIASRAVALWKLNTGANLQALPIKRRKTDC